MILQQKAWAINPANFDQPWHVPDSPYYAETQGKAKQKVLADLRYDDYVDLNGKPIDFLNLKVKRAKHADKYLVDGQQKTLGQIEYDERRKQKVFQISKLVADNPNAMAYIRKGGKYYRPSHSGYTEILTNAGIYPIAEAARTVLACSLDDRMMLEVIDSNEHNKMMNQAIEDLKSRII